MVKLIPNAISIEPRNLNYQQLGMQNLQLQIQNPKNLDFSIK